MLRSKKPEGKSVWISPRRSGGGPLGRECVVLARQPGGAEGTWHCPFPSPVTLPDLSILSLLTLMGHQLNINSSLYAQQAIAEGEQLSWLSEKRLLSQQLECLQRAVARLELEKAELKQLNAELRRTLEQVKQAFTASAKPHGPLDHTTFPQTALWSPLLVSFPLPLPPVDTRFCICSLFWHPVAFTNAHSLRSQPSCPSVPIHAHLTLLCQDLFPLALSLP